MCVSVLPDLHNSEHHLISKFLRRNFYTNHSLFRTLKGQALTPNPYMLLEF